MLSELVCSISGHKISRRRVWQDELAFRTQCQRCGAQMIRDAAGWRKFDADLDAVDKGSSDQSVDGSERQTV